MFLGKDLIGNPVIDTGNGKIVGHVKDIYLDEEMEKVAGLYLGGSGLFSRQHQFVPRNRVETLGVDTILLTAGTTVRESDDPDNQKGWVRRDDLQGRPVDTPGGTKIGTIDDVVFDEEGQMAGFSLWRVYVSGPMAEKRAVARSAVLDTGTADGAMTIDLPHAEQQDLAVTPPAIFASEKVMTENGEAKENEAQLESESESVA